MEVRTGINVSEDGATNITVEAALDLTTDLANHLISAYGVQDPDPYTLSHVLCATLGVLLGIHTTDREALLTNRDKAIEKLDKAIAASTKYNKNFEPLSS